MDLLLTIREVDDYVYGEIENSQWRVEDSFKSKKGKLIYITQRT